MGYPQFQLISNVYLPSCHNTAALPYSGRPPKTLRLICGDSKLRKNLSLYAISIRLVLEDFFFFEAEHPVYL